MSNEERKRIWRETWRPIAWEDAAELHRQGALAEKQGWTGRTYGISATTKERVGPAVVWAYREEVARAFTILETPTITDPGHLTIALPRPVTDEAARRLNELFGRRRP